MANHIYHMAEENLHMNDEHMKYNIIFETVYQHNTDSSTSQKYNPNHRSFIIPQW